MDAQGAPIVGATVTVRNRDTHATFTTKTRVGGGDFVVPDLEAAPYAVTVEQEGFK